MDVGEGGEARLDLTQSRYFPFDRRVFFFSITDDRYRAWLDLMVEGNQNMVSRSRSIPPLYARADNARLVALFRFEFGREESTRPSLSMSTATRSVLSSVSPKQLLELNFALILLRSDSSSGRTSWFVFRFSLSFLAIRN